ncbi:hypothetical protein [Brucella sp. IR073]|uniref:hypothetical protein n=1 Tax=unclassified Brucella TaxID=2632610 RepID=UPI003B98574E
MTMEANRSDDFRTPASRPAQFDKQIIFAIRACIAGTASEGQQKAAMAWIVEQASGYGKMSYGKGDPYDTAFHEGRRFVGYQIIRMTLDEAMKLVERPAKTRGKPKEASE